MNKSIYSIGLLAIGMSALCYVGAFIFMILNIHAVLLSKFIFYCVFPIFTISIINMNKIQIDKNIKGFNRGTEIQKQLFIMNSKSIRYLSMINIAVTILIIIINHKFSIKIYDWDNTDNNTLGIMCIFTNVFYAISIPALMIDINKKQLNSH
jgi:hypothetical protein